MRVMDVMTDSVEVLAPTATLRDAARKMKELDVGAIPIQQGDKIVGIITDRDIVIRAVAEGRDPDKVTVKDAMTSGVTTCYFDDDVDRLREIMENEQIRRVVVLDRSQKLVGIVSLGDVALAEVDGTADEISAEILKEVSKPGGPNR